MRLVPELHEPPEAGHPVLTVNGRAVALPDLRLGQAISHEGVGGIKHWPGGFKQAEVAKTPVTELLLQPGANKVTLTWSNPATFPGSVNVLLYRVWEMEK